MRPVIVVLLYGAAAWAQAPIHFASATVNPNHSGDAVAKARTQGGSFLATNATLRLLVTVAYGIQTTEQLVGGPAWMDTDRFDIDATAPAGSPQQRTPAMLQDLLAKRFDLVVHIEHRERLTYHLKPLRADGILGPHLRRSQCLPPSERTERPKPCGDVDLAVGGVHMTGATPIEWIGTIEQNTDLRIVDNTGLTGTFDLDLTWLPNPIRPGFPPSDPHAPPLETALQEQLGLKLELERTPVDVLVVDSAEKPFSD